MDGESPDGQPSPSTWRLAVQYIACYLQWFVICGIGLWLVFLIRQNLVEDILFMRVNPWQLRSIDRWALFFFGAIWIVSIFLIEGYLRRAVEEGKLWTRAGSVLLIQLTLVGLSFLIRAL